MGYKTFCDICDKVSKNIVKVGWEYMYCKECWQDRKNWPKIHKDKDSKKSSGKL